MIKLSDRMLFGLDEEYKKLQKSILNTQNGKGTIYLISGESNFGKTHLLKFLKAYTEKTQSGIISSYVEVEPPIGEFQISNLKPLYPFQQIIEQLVENKNMSPEKRLAVNMAMSFFAALPLVGDVAYLAKEWKRDLKEFKGVKSTQKKDEIVIDKYIKALKKYAEKFPIMMLIDDIHWADTQSLELIKELSKEIEKLPIFIAVSYKPSEVEGKALPMYNFLKEIRDKSAYNSINLDVLNKNEIREVSEYLVRNYNSGTEFDKWLLDKSFGVPGIVYEYLNYFKDNSPFNKEGLLVKSLDEQYLPGSIQAVFSQKLDLLDEEKKNILALCSAEGKQFTATIAADLLNTDILDAIKKLRTIQNKTGIIKSIGAKKRYGVKTTIYEFTQGFYQNYFENSLEYEEYIAIHGQIASLLKQKYAEAEADEIKEEIAPFLAAHSAEAGDDETVHEMLLRTAKSAKEFGSADVLRDTLERVKNYGSITQEDTQKLKDSGYDEIYDEISNVFGFADKSNNGGGNDNGNGFNAEPKISLDVDFDVIKERILEFYHAKKFKLASENSLAYIEQHRDKLSTSKITLLRLLAAKSDAEAEDYLSAEDNLNSVLNLTEKTGDDEMLCITWNVFAIVRFNQGENQKAMNYLNKAAQISFKVAPEIRLLTLSNIATISKVTNPEMAEKYFESARTLSKELGFKEFSNDLFELI